MLNSERGIRVNKVKRPEDLEVFKRAHSLTLRIYKNTKNFPPDERFGLAKGSVGGQYHLLLAKDLEYLSNDEYDFLGKETEEISKMLNGLVKSLSE